MPRPSLQFLFDLGKVLVHPNFEQCSREIAEYATESEKEILRQLLEGDLQELIDHFDKGTISGEEFAQELETRFGWHGSLQQLEAIWQRMLQPDEEMVQLVYDLLDQDFGVYILSNINPFHTGYTRTSYSFVSRSHGAIFSCECGMIKPEEEIFQHTIQTLKIEPEKTLFIDDRADNIAAAKRVGFMALQHQSAKETKSVIAELIRRNGHQFSEVPA